MKRVSVAVLALSLSACAIGEMVFEPPAPRSPPPPLSAQPAVPEPSVVSPGPITPTPVEPRSPPSVPESAAPERRRAAEKPPPPPPERPVIPRRSRYYPPAPLPTPSPPMDLGSQSTFDLVEESRMRSRRLQIQGEIDTLERQSRLQGFDPLNRMETLEKQSELDRVNRNLQY